MANQFLVDYDVPSPTFTQEDDGVKSDSISFFFQIITALKLVDQPICEGLIPVPRFRVLYMSMVYNEHFTKVLSETT